MFIMLCAVTYLTSRIGDELQDGMSSQIDVLTEAQRLEHYGTVLGLSVISVSRFGDRAAAERYEAVQPQLRKSISKLRRHLRLEENQATAARVDQVDLALVGMEKKAIALARLGRLQEAQSIVEGQTYKQLFNIYFASVETIEARAEAFVTRTEARLQWYLYANFALTVGSFGLIILGWMAIVRPARTWGAHLEDARSTAETARRQLEESQVELFALNSKLFEQARRDPLTKLQTRLKLDEDLESLWPRVERYGERYCAIMCDIDHFKSYNDTYGHLAGDEVLKQVADALSSVCRRGDHIYRFGGEEFVIILSDCSVQGGIISADRYRAAVEAAKIPHSGSRSGIVTASLGVAPLEPGSGSTIHSWLHEADVALYRAKGAGRNRVVGCQAVSA